MKKFKSDVLNLHKLKVDVEFDRPLKNVYQAYQTSWETQQLEGNQYRLIHCDLIEVVDKDANQLKLHEKSNLPVLDITNKITDDDESDDEDELPQQLGKNTSDWWTNITVETRRPKLLREIAIESIGKNFKRGKIDGRIVCEDKEKLGKFIDSEIDILDLLEVDNVTLWKSLVKSKMPSLWQFEKLSREIASDSSWKKIGIQLKLEEIIENMPEADYRYESTRDKLQRIVDGLVDHVEALNIKKLQCRLDSIHHPVNKFVEMVNIPDSECHHGSLEFLGRLKNLKSLSVNFKPNDLQISYARRFVQSSTEDMKNLGKALMNLKNLEVLRIRGTRMRPSRKLCQIITALSQLENLKILDFSFCEIKSLKSGKLFQNLLETASSLKELHLKGNRIDESFCRSFSEGLRKFRGNFDLLDLSLNEILGKGMSLILKSIQESQNVKKLDVSQCDNLHSHNKTACLLAFIELIRSCSPNLRSLDFHLNEVGDESVKTEIIQALNLNYEIEELNVELCGFTTSQLVDAKVLIERNRYYRENPILRKQSFTLEDEIEIEKFLRRTKQPLLLKMQKMFIQSKRNHQSTHHKYTLHEETEENFLKFAKTF